MNSRNLHPYRLAFAILLLMTMTRDRSQAQQAGHYVAGITGLDNGSTAPPGVYISYIPYIYDIDSFRGPRGAVLAKPDFTTVVHNVVYQVTTHQKILGAEYGIGIIIPVVNTRVVANFINTTAQSAGVSDIYVEPVVLGWSRGRANVLLNYGFYAPAGDFNPTKTLNPGLGFWEHQIQTGASYSFDQKKLWNASALASWDSI